jgi:hypothetical protein
MVIIATPTAHTAGAPVEAKRSEGHMPSTGNRRSEQHRTFCLLIRGMLEQDFCAFATMESTGRVGLSSRQIGPTHKS